MTGDRVHGINKGLARTSKVNWRCVIYTGRGWEVQIRKRELSMSWDRCGQTGM